jgi:hypothetical protein
MHFVALAVVFVLHLLDPHAKAMGFQGAGAHASSVSIQTSAGIDPWNGG